MSIWLTIHIVCGLWYLAGVLNGIMDESSFHGGYAKLKQNVAIFVSKHPLFFGFVGKFIHARFDLWHLSKWTMFIILGIATSLATTLNNHDGVFMHILFALLIVTLFGVGFKTTYHDRK